MSEDEALGSRTSFRPFSQRQSGLVREEALFEGVPDHLNIALREWIYTATTERMARRVCLRLRLPHLSARDLAQGVDEPTILDVIDALLWIGLETVPSRERISPRATRGVIHAADLVDELQEILEEGGSAYCVNADRDGLETRVDPTASAAMHAIRQSLTKTGREGAADLLRDAWAKVYGMRPDPGEAYSDAVKAVEALACPLFLPHAQQPTLGTVKTHLEQASAKYELVISGRDANPAPVDAAVAMIGLLWHGQRERHAGGPTSAPITQEAAEAAVHLALTLVQWLEAGAIRQK
ncbi:hypothetical protein KDK95_23280 [Actinospica sp. MGRD01-02]|uniref:Uncharacterized protein n=1 Tax=Actinospica acidithermotolerans TaxID=2828514 RepID=A0A941EAI8_9ACTN|nr:hypothetical protein [Actinospica acidithermotolerans]MBR7829250.1 hypothetical protein [Actinospica acidithermotolerans]